MKKKEVLSLFVSIIALSFSILAVYKNYFESAKIDIEVSEGHGWLFEYENLSVKQSILIPVLFVNKANNLGFVRKISFRSVTSNCKIHCSNFAKDFMELYWPDSVKHFTTNIYPHAEIFTRDISKPHPFSIKGKSEVFKFIKFNADSIAFFKIREEFELIIATSNDTIVRRFYFIKGLQDDHEIIFKNSNTN